MKIVKKRGKYPTITLGDSAYGIKGAAAIMNRRKKAKKKGGK